MLELIKTKQEQLPVCRTGRKEISFKLYSRGLSTKDVGDLLEDIYGKQYSKSGISRLCEESRKEALNWINRPIDKYYPVIYIDAHYNSVRRENRVKKEAFYVIIGVKADFTREVLVIENIPTESSSLWTTVIQGLKNRGLEEVDLVVSDGLPQIENATEVNFQNADIQLCVTHLNRELLKMVRSESKPFLAEDLKKLLRQMIAITIMQMQK